MPYENILSPLKIGMQVVRNRIAMSPMGTSLQDPQGMVTSEMVDFYETRAKGGTGMIISPFTAVDGRYRTLTLGLHSREFIPGISRLAEAVQFYGAKFILQLSHFGGKAPRFLTGKEPIAPSSIESPMYPEVPREMTEDEIEEAIGLYIQSAIMARDAGCDGIELHGAHTYLIGQFVSPHANRRDDEYGGDFERRMNFVRKIVEGIRSVCGTGFIVGYKFSAYEHLEGGIDEKLAVSIARYMEDRGADYLHVSAYSTTLSGLIDTEYQSVPTIYYPQGTLIPLAEKVKQAVRKVPVMGTGGISDPELAEEILKSGKADLIAMGRALIADPEWVNKIKNGDAIRQCIRCQVCYKRVLTQRWVRCTVNPVTCEERRYEKFTLQRTQKPKKVVILGAGPAGMEAAIRAKQRGHDVVLYEKERQIGGNLIYAGRPAFKRELRMLLETYKTELKLLEIDVRTGKTVNRLDDIRDEKADVILIAIGSEPIIPEIEGIDGPNVITMLDYFQKEEGEIGENILVVGAGDVGCEIAMDLSLKGRRVKVVDTISEEEMLVDEIMPYRTCVVIKARKEGVEIMDEMKIELIDNRGMWVKAGGGEKKFLQADTVIVAAGFTCKTKRIDELKRSFLNEIPEVYDIGDCANPGRLYEAIHSGAETAWKI
jgi:2,4-dienoyl-CoA reductase-like NADH-dependent reductase (Old Yellow Enzyme family)/thioredoxin reductase